MSQNSNYYRNITQVFNIDPGALWIRSGSFLTLVDDDQFVRVPFDPERFEPVPANEAVSGDIPKG